VEGGVGGTPAIARLRSDIFSFAPQRQANVLLAASNTGADDRSAFRDFYAEREFEVSLVDAGSPLPPPFLVPVEDYRDNLSGAGAFNFLNKLSEYDQLKIGGFLNGDRIDYLGSNTVNFFDAARTASLTEELAKREEILLANARLIYERNAPTIYWKTTLQHDWRREMNTSRNDLNGTLISADQETNQHDLRLNTNLILRKGNRARQLFGRFEQKTVEDSFRVAPVSLFSDLGLLSAAGARQELSRRVQEGELSTQYYLRWGKMTGQIQLKGQLHTDRLSSELDFEDVNEGNPPGFENATWQRRITLAGNPKLRRETEKYILTLEAPLGLHFVSLRDAGLPTRHSSIPFVKPSVSYGRKLSQARYLSATISYHNDYDQDRILFSNYLLRSERNLERRVFQLNQFQKYRGELRFGSSSLNNKLKYEGFGQVELNQRNFIDATDFAQQGAAVEQLAGSSTQRSLSWTNSISTFLWRNISFELDYRRQQISVPLVLNGSSSRINNGSNNWELKLSKVFNRQVLTLTGSWERQNNDLIDNKLNEWYTRLAYFQQLGRKEADIQLNVQYFYVTTGVTNASNWLLDLRFRRPILKSKYQLIVHLRNLTNTENFRSLGLYAFSSQISDFRLRPRQLWLGLRRAF
jgi:hypothetical protein